MPKTETSAHSTERVKLQTTPVYFVRFFHKSYTTLLDYAFSRDVSSAAVVSPTKTKLPYLVQIGGNTQSIEPEMGRSSIGAFQLLALDVGGELLKHLSQPTTITLNGTHGVGVTTITVNQDPSGFPAVGTLELFTASVGERVRYTAVNIGAKQFTGCTRGVDGTTEVSHASGDGVFNGECIRPGQRAQVYAGYAPLAEADYMSFCKMDVAARRLLGDGVTFQIDLADMQRSLRRTVFLLASPKVPVVLTGNPFTLMLRVLLSTGLGTNTPGGTNYDVLSANNGLGIPHALVDITGIETLRDAAFSGQTYSFSITEALQGKEAIEVEILKTTECYPFITQDGKFSVKRYAGLTLIGSPPTLNESSIISWSWSLGDQRVINVVDIDYDWHLPTAPGQFATRQEYVHAGSVTLYGKRPALSIQSKGLKSTDASVQTMANDRAREVTRRFAAPPPVLSATVFFRHHVVDIGDQVYVTHTKIPNTRTGLRGLTAELFEVIDVTPNFAQGNVTLSLLWIGGLGDPGAPSSSGVQAIGAPPLSMLGLDLPTGINLAGAAVLHFVTFSGSGGYSSRKMTDAMTAYTIQSGDRLEYDIWLLGTAPVYAGADLQATDASTFRASGAVDQNGLSCSPNTDLSAYALGQWYHRVIPFPGGWTGKQLDFGLIAFGNSSGAVSVSCFLANVAITGSNTLINFAIMRHTELGTFLTDFDASVSASVTQRVTSGQVNVIDGVVSLAVTRGGIGNQTYGATTSTTGETTRVTHSAIAITLTAMDTIRLIWTVDLKGVGTTETITWRIRRTNSTGQLIATYAGTINASTVKGVSTSTTVELAETGFAIDSPAAAGTYNYVLTAQSTATTSTDEAIAFKLRAEVRTS